MAQIDTSLRTRPRAAVRPPRYPRNAAPPVLVEVRRGGLVESRHRGHVVQVDATGIVRRGIGDPDVLVTLRSAVKPFSLVALVEAGAVEALRLSDEELAVMAASHTGEDAHVRTLQGVLRRAAIGQSLLACPSDGAPLDELTAARLARDGEAPGPIRHMCSGFHVASLLLARHAGWPLDGYWRPDHPAQLAARDAVARIFGVRPASLRTAIDACGLLTYGFPLVEVARAFALLADPAGVADSARRPLADSLIRIRDAMVGAPQMVGGTRDASDTLLMRAGAGRLVCKGGAEGLRGIGILPAAAGAGRNGEAGHDGGASGGLAITIEDGDLAGRANRSVSVEALAQLGLLDGEAVASVDALRRQRIVDPRGEQIGETLPVFELAPLSELIG